MISVIIPVYKVEQYLDSCLDSVTSQTYSDLEIILVDDGSPDNCPAMCDAWAAQDPRIKVIHTANGGVSSARNTAIDEALGEFILFVDSDDLVHPQAVELLVECQKQFDSDFVIGRRTNSINEKNWYLTKYRYSSELAKEYSVKEFINDRRDKGYITGRLIRRSVIKDIRFPVGIGLGEDWIYNYNLLSYRGLTISVLDLELYYYRYHDGSATIGRQAFEGYYYIAEWSNKNINRFDDSIKGFIIKEALKKSFLYRFEFKNDQDGKHCAENKQVMKELVRKCKIDRFISFKEKMVYITMARLPFSYDVYVKMCSSLK